MKIVKIIDGVPMVTSNAIAEHFGRDHKNVLASIRKVINSNKISELEIKPSDYIDKNGDAQPCFNLTEKGFMVACPFIGGDKALEDMLTEPGIDQLKFEAGYLSTQNKGLTV